MKNNFNKIQKSLKKVLDEERYEHTIGVAYTAACLAMCHDYDIPKAKLAGLLHDCAKCMPDEKKIQLCEKHNLQISDIERRSPFLLHAKLGAFLAMHKYHVEDKEIVSAILNHTTGKPNMSVLDKIIYIADYIEPQRTKQKNLTEIRKLAFLDLDKALYYILENTLTYLHTIDGDIDLMTQKAYDYYLEKNKKKEGSR